jgi:hypothetical protein
MSHSKRTVIQQAAQRNCPHVHRACDEWRGICRILRNGFGISERYLMAYHIVENISGDKFRRIFKTGRNKSTEPLATKKIIWNVTEQQKEEFSAMAKEYGMSESKLVDILVFIGKRSFLNQKTA